jgi:hypothetical protein
MTKRQAVETVNRTLKDIMGCNQPFGGKVTLFEGDFRQLLPVVTRGTRAQITDATLLKSYIWDNVRRIRPTQNMRAKNKNWFADYLLRIGNKTEKIFGDNYVQLPDDIIVEWRQDSSQNANKISSKDNPIDNLIEKVFSKLKENCTSAEYMRKRAILSTTKEHVDALNAIMIEKFLRDDKVFYSSTQWMTIQGIITLLIFKFYYT